MEERPPVVLIAMPPTEVRCDVVRALEEREFDVRTGDNAVVAVDRIRAADVVLVGGFPDAIQSVLLDAATPPGLSRPTVVVESTMPESTTPESTASESTASESMASESTASESTASESTASESTASESSGCESSAGDLTAGADDVPSVSADAPDAVVDAVERAVQRREYATRVREFSAVAAEAASCEHESGELGQRVASLAAEARRAHRNFSETDWTATFRAI